MAQKAKNLLIKQEPRFNPWVGKIPWRKKGQPTPVSLPGEFHRQKSLASYSPQGHKESDMTEQLTFNTRKTKSMNENKLVTKYA